MPPWYSSWLPGLPSLNFALPSGLQGRFVSFVLKKSLGHFLRPGQLDYRQIDSQIGSGFVQVNDLELDNQAINLLISDLPVTLHDGFISSVVARVPWPNPLTSTLGFSIDSLHLTFHLLPPSFHAEQKGSNLADSVASVAESFIHDELTLQEGAALWDSFHPNITSQVGDDLTVPGGLAADPFLSNPEDAANMDIDPAGVSIFASLIERLLARFEFEAANTKITLVHPGNLSISASISDIRYHTDDNGVTSGLSITGLTLMAYNLRSERNSPDPSTPVARSPTMSHISQTSSSQDLQPTSPSSSSSSLDDETQFAMSQSLAFLPPRQPSPTDSIGSSVYQSAVSFAPTSTDNVLTTSSSVEDFPAIPRPDDTYAQQNDGETLVSFGSTSVLVQVSPPATAHPNSEKPSSPPTSPSISDTTGTKESIHFTVSVGVVACAFRAWHIRGLLALVDVFTPHIGDNPVHSSDPECRQPAMGIEVSIKLRGLVLVIPLPSSHDMEDVLDGSSLDEFFKWPLVPPVLRHNYLRLNLEAVSTSISLDELSEAKGKESRYATGDPLSYGLTVGDASLFFVRRTYPPTSTSDSLLISSPIIITDTGLLSQYTTRHDHPLKDKFNLDLPTFEVMDWTDKTSPPTNFKLSSWRTNLPQRRKVLPQEGNAVPESPPAIFITTKKTWMTIQQSDSKLDLPPNKIEIRLAPLHIFLDLGALCTDEILKYLNEVNSTTPSIVTHATEDGGGHSDSNDDEVQTMHNTSPTRQRLKKLALRDRQFGIAAETTFVKRGKEKSNSSTKPQIKTTVMFGMLRIQIRCPPPPSRSPRSGALVIDIHGLRVFTMPEPSKKMPKFTLPESPQRSQGSRRPNGMFILGADLQRIVIAFAPLHEPTATSLISIGSLGSGADSSHVRHEFERMAPPLKPRIAITTHGVMSGKRSTTLVISVDIPSALVDVSKPLLDGLQYWADDVTQLLDRTFNEDHADDDTLTEKADSREASLIGSRFFTKSRSGSGSTLNASSGGTRSETVMKVSITEAVVRASVPRVSQRCSYPFIVCASDIDILGELQPDTRDEMVLTLEIMDVTLIDLPLHQPSRTILSLTTTHSLSSTPKSMVKLRFTSLVVPGTMAKESKVKLTLSGFTFTAFPDVAWITDLSLFGKSPPGTFESVIPSERTRITLGLSDGAIRAFAPKHPGAVVIRIDNLNFATDVIGESPDSSFKLSIPALALLAVDDVSNDVDESITLSRHGATLWKEAGYALIAEVADFSMNFMKSTKLPNVITTIDHIRLQVHICADSLAAVTAFTNDFVTVFKPEGGESKLKHSRGPTVVTKETASTGRGLMASVDDLAFKKVPEIGPAPDMINDDLPTNMDYLDESFGAAAGLRELRDDDLDEFDIDEPQPEYYHLSAADGGAGVISKIGGETIKMLRPESIRIDQSYFNNLSPDASGVTDEYGETLFQLCVHDSNITLFLYDGYDWSKTRKVIEEEVKGMRRRLAKIRQLVASGQAHDSGTDETSTLLFNSLYIGLEGDVEGLEPGAIIAAIDEELKDDLDMASQSSWQSLKPPVAGKLPARPVRVHGKRLTRSRGPSMEFCFMGLKAEINNYRPEAPVVSRTFITVRDVEILDHIKTSTWKKFLTELHSDSHGNIRETDSSMVRVELLNVRPDPGYSGEEARLRAKILPLRLYVDQDAVDFLKRFFSFKDPDNNALPAANSDVDEIYFQSAEVFPVDLKLDYKPRRVDYRALREGRTIELMNFFHFDGAEMTLRHITLAGITGWPRVFELLNDLWTPDVKATQLMEVISGVAPIRSVVNVGSGVADLVLLPIAQYKKDGRVVRGMQKGSTAFMKSTAIEAIKLGARLATGTQVILEQAEGVLGGQFSHPITTETVPSNTGEDFTHLQTGENEDSAEIISKYAQQPVDIKEGVQTAYRSLRRNLNSAAQTILAVPMEVYERSGNEGPVRSVIRAVPIAVLKPMIGASEAVSKTLLGLHNSLDPNVRHENEAKYKHR